MFCLVILCKPYIPLRHVWVCSGEEEIALLIGPTRTSGKGEAIVDGAVRKVSWRRQDLQPQGKKRTGEGVETVIMQMAGKPGVCLCTGMVYVFRNGICVHALIASIVFIEHLP